MKKPEFENKITLGNVLTVIPMLIAAVAAYSDLRADAAAMRIRMDGEAVRMQEVRARVEKLEARDEVFANNFAAYQRDTIQALTRLETQMGILLQAGRPGALPGVGPRREP